MQRLAQVSCYHSADNRWYLGLQLAQALELIDAYKVSLDWEVTGWSSYFVLPWGLRTIICWPLAASSN